MQEWKCFLVPWGTGGGGGDGGLRSARRRAQLPARSLQGFCPASACWRASASTSVVQRPQYHSAQACAAHLLDQALAVC